MRTALFVVLLATLPARAGDVVMTDEAKKSTTKALEYLASKQNADGSWSESRYPHSTAITAIALLAFMSQGHLPGQGLYGPEVGKGARFLISAARESDGYLIGSRGGNMYCHGLAALALAELWGMTHDDEFKKTLTKAINLIITTQNREGGWRYDPAPTGADISVTIMQVMALRTAKNGGLHVPDNTMKDAIRYIKSCYNSSSGGFVYQPFSSKPGFARSAAGICVLQLAGEYEAREIPKAVAYLKDNFNAREHYWYGQYYAAHAMHQIGGKEWEDWYKRMTTTFIPMQSPDGSWSKAASDKEGVGPVYTTAIAVIALSAPANYLPIFQR